MDSAHFAQSPFFLFPSGSLAILTLMWRLLLEWLSKSKNPIVMKFNWTSLLVIPLFFSLAAMAATEKKPQFDLDEKTVEIKNGLWMSKFEVSNTLYKEFLMGLIEDGRADEVPAFAPDMKVWKEDVNFTNPYTDYYFKHPAFMKYPVVGVSHEAATAFCAWLTTEIGDAVYSKANGKGAKVRYRFRLPTEAEWELGASIEGRKSSEGYYAGGYSYPRDDKGRYLFNHKLGPGNFAGIANGKSPKDYEGYMITCPVDGFREDERGLYNMSGNVSEMVAEYGISKGGSWADEARACVIGAVEAYEKPTAKRGFRFVIEVAKFEEVGYVE